MFHDFRATLIEGSFSSEGGSLVCEEEGGARRDVGEVLTAFDGVLVRVATCRLPVSGEPVPLAVSAEGVLEVDQGDWRVVTFAGATRSLRLCDLAGHQGRIVVADLADVERMRDAAGSAVDRVRAEKA